MQAAFRRNRGLASATDEGGWGATGGKKPTAMKFASKGKVGPAGSPEKMRYRSSTTKIAHRCQREGVDMPAGTPGVYSGTSSPRILRKRLRCAARHERFRGSRPAELKNQPCPGTLSQRKRCAIIGFKRSSAPEPFGRRRNRSCGRVNCRRKRGVGAWKGDAQDDSTERPTSRQESRVRFREMFNSTGNERSRL